jgi:hypothetical protein
VLLKCWLSVSSQSLGRQTNDREREREREREKRKQFVCIKSIFLYQSSLPSDKVTGSGPEVDLTESLWRLSDVLSASNVQVTRQHADTRLFSVCCDRERDRKLSNGKLCAPRYLFFGFWVRANESFPAEYIWSAYVSAFKHLFACRALLRFTGLNMYK